jgi:hypothetical protein
MSGDQKLFAFAIHHFCSLLTLCCVVVRSCPRWTPREKVGCGQEKGDDNTSTSSADENESEDETTRMGMVLLTTAYR